MKRRADGRWCKDRIINGKRVIFYSSATTERQAIKDIENQMLLHTEKEEKGKRFKEVAEEWENTHCDKLEHNTKKVYTPTVKQLKEHFGGEYIRRIEPNNITAYIYEYSQKGYAQKTVKRRLNILSQIFKYAMIKGYVTSNPCLYIEVPKNLVKNRREMPSEEEVEVVKNGLGCTFGLFAYFVLYTGLRRGEALALTYDDIDFENKEINITKSVYYEGNTPKIKQPKTANGIRQVPLLDNLYDVLIKCKCKGHLFCNENGEIIRNGHFTRLWDKYKKETGLELTPHQLRHAYATILFEAGIDPKDAHVIMGHTFDVMRNIYTHISERRKKETKDKLNIFVSQNQVKAEERAV